MAKDKLKPNINILENYINPESEFEKGKVAPTFENTLKLAPELASEKLKSFVVEDGRDILTQVECQMNLVTSALNELIADISNKFNATATATAIQKAKYLKNGLWGDQKVKSPVECLNQLFHYMTVLAMVRYLLKENNLLENKTINRVTILPTANDSNKSDDQSERMNDIQIFDQQGNLILVGEAFHVSEAMFYNKFNKSLDDLSKNKASFRKKVIIVGNKDQMTFISHKSDSRKNNMALVKVFTVDFHQDFLVEEFPWVKQKKNKN
ncbi:hypothetical protein M5X11_16325 [Paenibacillus alginolyticus]|uniref:hypothetical protein n=1 Tax=Paenibacillus alginolyticus TaxID=59839 RepID=UPI0004195408|nr:hypothetical protein [Paenibacillus alginolyticus]MCY9666508.1 hypothetical protein [Paenibacillus alginolyticus]